MVRAESIINFIMNMYQFAGAIFTNEEIATFAVVALVVATIAIAAVLYLIFFLYNKGSKNNKRPKISKVIGLALLVIIVPILVIVIRTNIQDRNWEKKQQDCAEETGYSEFDNLSPSNQAEAQSKYFDCTSR